MKKTMFLSLGLLACVAFSPPSAFAEPDTGPSISEDNKTLFDNSASADLTMSEQGVFEISNTYNYNAFEQANGQETGVHRSDHSVMTTHYILKNSCLESKLVNVSKYGDPHGWFDHRSRGDTKLGSNSENQNFNVISAASMAALHSHQMVLIMRRPPAWPIRPSRL